MNISPAYFYSGPESIFKIMAKKNILTRARKQQALALMQQGNPAKARPLLEQISRTDRSDIEAQFMLGIANGMLGEHSAAEQAFRQILKLAPGHPDANNNLGLSLEAQGRSEQAIEFFSKAVALAPDNPGFVFNFANALESLGKLEQARVYYEKAISLAPDYAEAFCNLGNVLQELGNRHEAVAAFEKAIALDDDFVRDYPQVYINLGNALQAIGQDEAAARAYQRAVDIRPDYAPAFNSLGNALLQQNRRPEAVKVLRQALTLNPGYTMAYRNLVDSTKYTEPDADVEAMLKLYTDPATRSDAKMDLAFALGKVYADLKDDARSFEFYATGNRLKRESLDYDIERDRKFFAAIREVFNPDFIRRYSHIGQQDTAPIFILGMPRSGTSLVEQILASHSQVYGAGELDDMRIATDRACAVMADRYPLALTQLGETGLAAIGSTYLARLHAYAPDAQRISDKMPHNFLYLGLIHLLFPRARIIHCRRNPMDNALSIYKVLFNTGHSYAYDLAELGEYFRLYQELMEYWRQLLPGAFYDLSYETLVGDQEVQTRCLLEYCELPWEDACLEFHRNRRAVRTASLVQVRQPMHANSVGGWARFAEQLQPFIAALRDERSGQGENTR